VVYHALSSSLAGLRPGLWGLGGSRGEAHSYTKDQMSNRKTAHARGLLTTLQLE